jgi:hypothetical protein
MQKLFAASEDNHRKKLLRVGENLVFAPSPPVLEIARPQRSGEYPQLVRGRNRSINSAKSHVAKAT